MVKLRNRDVGAAVLAVVLARMAWTDNFGPESLSSSVNLAFYAPYRSTAANPRKIDRRLSRPGVGVGMGMAGTALLADLDVGRPVPLDVDGDGTVEALVVPAVLKNGTVGGGDADEEGGDAGGARGGGGRLESVEAIEWGLRVLDLKPMHAARTAADEMALFPFRPRVMFESKPILEPPVGVRAGGGGKSDDAAAKKKEEEGDEADRYLVPLRLATGQLYLKPPPPGPSDPKDNFVPSDDRTRHYFCGTDWHDAARRCGAPCPGGTASDCPGGEQCYADTPCDSKAPPTPAPTPRGPEKDRTVLVETPGGGLPSVVTAWSDGSVTLHAVTGEYNPRERRRRGRKARKGEPDPDLELRLVWRARPFREDEGKKKKEDGEGGEGGGEEGDKKKDEDDKARKLKGWQGGGLKHAFASQFQGGSDRDRDLSGQFAFKELDLLLDSDAPLGRNGAVLFVARYVDGSSRTSTSYFALDAATGEVLWSHRGRAKPLFPWMDRARTAAQRAKANADKAAAGSEEEREERKRLEDEGRMTGLARRRSHLMDILGAGGGAGGGEDSELEEDSVVDDVLLAEDCLVKYRHWILDPSTGALPHLHWGGGGAQDARLHVAHFDRRHGHVGGDRAGAARGGPLGSKTKKKKRRGGGGSGKDPAWQLGEKGWQRKMLTPGRKAAGTAGGGESGPGGKRKHHKHRRGGGPGHPVHAKPNVLLFHHEDGLSVLSLKNGRPVCHLSLADDSLYDDLNGDGVIDQVQILRGGLNQNANAFRHAAQGIAGMMGRAGMDEKEGETAAEERKKESAKFAGDLVQRIMREQAEARGGGEEEEGGDEKKRRFPGMGVGGAGGSLCHAMVLSGLPAREKVFDATLCDPSRAYWDAQQRKAEDVAGAGAGGAAGRAAAARARQRGGAVGAAPPLAVETLDARSGPRERDVVFAVGTGSVSRYDPHGSLLWRTSRTGGPDEAGGVPTWGADAGASPGASRYAAGRLAGPPSPAYLDRVDFAAARRAGTAAVRPILASGEDGLAVLSAGRGRILAYASYPQPASSRPLLADVSGDGTTDAVVVSADGVWGYKVRVETGGSKFLRIAVGLLLMGIGAAALRNKFGQPPGVDRRSTDY